VGHCYIFNPAAANVQVTLNSSYLGEIAATVADGDYAPQSMMIPTQRHEDSGVIGIGGPNLLSVFYPDDPKKEYGPYSVQICLFGRNISVDDDIIVYLGRETVAVMTARGFIVDTTCPPETKSLGREKAPSEEKKHAR
jgi:hypothetical protein